MKLRLSYGLIGLVLVVGILVLGIFAPLFSHVDPNYNGPFSFTAMFTEQAGTQAKIAGALEPHPAPVGSPEIWSKLLYGTRWTLTFGVVIGLGRVALGLLFGMMAGMGVRGWKWLIGRLYLFSTAVPPLLIYLFLFALQILLPPDPALRWPLTWIYVTIITVLEAPRVMVVVQGRLEELQQEAFYEGALAAGNTRFRALRKHLLPHLMPTLATQFASEVARGLLVVAAMGVFKIYLMGRRVDLETDPAGQVTGATVTSLSPEWGAMLVETIPAFRQNPGLPLIPASAFAILVVGFTLLSDGMEAILGLLRRPLYWLRLHSRFWQWGAGLVAAALIGALLYFQGLPWGRVAGAEAVVKAEVQALMEHQRAAFLAPVDPKVGTFRAEQAQFFDNLQAKQATVVGSKLNLMAKGSQADGDLTLTLALPSGETLEMARRVHLVRRFGTWHDDGYGLYPFRTRLATIEGVFDVAATDPYSNNLRGYTQMLGRLVDRTLAALLADDKDLLHGGRLPVSFFPTDDALAWSMGLTKEELKGVYIWYLPDMTLRVSPSFFKGENEQLMGAVMQEQLTKLVIARRAPNVTPALVLGRVGMQNPLSKVNLNYSDQWVGTNLLPVRSLLALGLADFSGEVGHARLLQAMYLADWLAPQVSPEVLAQAAAQAPDAALQTLAKATGRSPEQLEAAYLTEVMAHLKKLSLLTTDQGKAKVPADLLRFVPILATAEAGSNGARLVEATPLKALTQDGHTTLYVLAQWQSDQGPLAGVERWELERSGQTWTLLPRASRLLGKP